MHGSFIWADLSSFRPDIVRTFYQKVMGWMFEDYVASTNNGSVAGLFEMPEFFVKIGMPSFWMSYIEVDDINAIVALAQANGGKVELGPEPMDGNGQYALIRDPLGAGFTVHQGSGLHGGATGTFSRLGHALFVSDAKVVVPFYQLLFGWEFGPANAGVQSFYLQKGLIRHLHEIPDQDLRGKEQYWAVLFNCPDLKATAGKVEASGGKMHTQMTLPEGVSLLCSDPDEAYFILTDGKW